MLLVQLETKRQTRPNITMDSAWSCVKCTFLNDPSLIHCEICETPSMTPLTTSGRSIQSAVVAAPLIDLSASPDGANVEDSTSDTHSAGPSQSITLIDLIIQNSLANNLRVSLCTVPPEHFTQRQGYGAKWSCGYRNIQMLCSAMMRIPEYREILFDGSGKIPTVLELQEYIEKAWEAGFDREGAEQLEHKLTGQDTWIGATECAALLRFFRVRARIIDFPRGEVGKRGAAAMTSSKTHSTVVERLVRWLEDYFQQGPCLPIYFQYQGHSITVVGIASEADEESTSRLIVFDPIQNSEVLHRHLLAAATANPNSKSSASRQWRNYIMKPISKLKSCDYQIVYIAPGLSSKGNAEYERSKGLESVRIE